MCGEWLIVLFCLGDGGLCILFICIGISGGEGVDYDINFVCKKFWGLWRSFLEWIFDVLCFDDVKNVL